MARVMMSMAMIVMIYMAMGVMIHMVMKMSLIFLQDMQQSELNAWTIIS